MHNPSQGKVVDIKGRTPDQLLYHISDTFNMTLHDTQGKVRGMAEKMFRMGPWKVSSDVVITSDILTPTSASVFVKVIGGLWFYMYSSQANLSLYALNASVLKLNVGNCVGFGGKSVEETLKTLKPGIVAKFYYSTKQGWVRYEDDTVGGHAEERAPVLNQSGQAKTS